MGLTVTLNAERGQKYSQYDGVWLQATAVAVPSPSLLHTGQPVLSADSAQQEPDLYVTLWQGSHCSFGVTAVSSCQEPNT